MKEYRGFIPFLLTDEKENIIYVCSSNRDIQDYSNVLNDIYDGNLLAFESNIHDDFTNLNYRLLKIIHYKKKYILLLSLDAFLKDYFKTDSVVKITKNKSFDIKNIEKKLIENGFTKVYMIEKQNEYSIRGDIIDIYSSEYENPIRVGLDFDDIVERITYFDRDTQKSIEKLDSIELHLDGNSKYAFLDLFKKIPKIYIENIELLKYKLEEIILRNRQNENIYKERFEKLVGLATPIEIESFTQKEITNFENMEYVKNLSKTQSIEIMSKEHKRYAEIFKDYNVKITDYPHYEGYKSKDKLVLTDRELKGIRVKRESKAKPKLRYKNPEEMKVGDYIIHENYGVGIYLGIEILEEREYLAIKYADEDKLYVPIERINKIEKYISESGEVPPIYNLGRRGFKRKKQKLYEDMVVFAREIVELQARREQGLGYQYSLDTVWQEEFEDAFPYTETQSQMQAIIDVKNDMESTKIMDRVICGDVGYGKTEVALRSAFKATTDGKQVVLMVPTTILAQQHYNRFKERMKNYPINIELLSRLKNTKEQKDSLQKIANGGVDIVIGTHRVISEDVKFKDLGLVIVDEEQKFGVKAKEKIKKYRSNVDMLTMTATPIPRTLNLSLLGIRDLSVIDTPPVGRKHPITEFVDKELIRDVVLKEISREGQIFYVFNSVEKMKNKVAELQELLPQFVKIEFIHGRLTPHEIKEKVSAFENGEIDILVATTIIENGIDIENANTMIIDGAEKLGLSQIYQLRGRIGRGNRQSYCYLIQNENKSKKARAREESLQLVEDGGGLALSMEDMKIRGAGEILGEKQHGAIETFGYNLYLKMLKEEIEKLKTGKVKTDEEFDDIDLKVDYPAYIPDEYIDKNQKIKVYRDLVAIDNEKELYEYKEEIADIYGKVPEPMCGLFRFIATKLKARNTGIRYAKSGKESIIKFNDETAPVEILIKMLKDKIIKYTDSVIFNGNIEDFLNIFEKYKKSV